MAENRDFQPAPGISSRWIETEWFDDNQKGAPL